MQWRINNYSHTYHGVPGRFDVNLYIPRITPTLVTSGDPNCYGYLFITLKVFYQKDNEGRNVNIDRNRFKTIPWPDSEWETYKSRIRALSTFWDSKFWLVLSSDRTNTSEYRNVERFIALYDNFLPHSFSGARQLRIYPRTISCRFSLEILNSAAGAHKEIQVAYIVDKNTNTPAGVDTYTNRSNDSYYDNGDVISDSNGYNTIIHELGHAIGIPHIGVVTNYQSCLSHDHFWDREGTNALECYEGPLTNDIMGSGGQLNWQDSVPWRFALQELTSVPYGYYIVHQMPMITTMSEIVTEGTPRWIEFHNGTSLW